MSREPDLVLAMSEPFDVPADAGPRGVPYQRFKVPTNFTEDKWISASEVRPGNRAVVHVPRLQRLMRHVCEHGFEHHAVMTQSHSAEVLRESFVRYLGWEVYHHDQAESS